MSRTGFRTWVFGTFVLVASVGHPVFAAKSHAKIDDAAVIQRLAAKGSPDSLATAAVLKRFGSETDIGVYPLIAKAVELAPGRSDFAWLAVRLCASAADCDPKAPEQHLRSVDPENAAGWIGDLARAQGTSDAAAVDAALARLGKAQRFYVYFNPLVVVMSRELAAARHSGSGAPDTTEVTSATMTMIGMVAASVFPGSQAFSFSCKGYALQIAGRLEHCRAMANAFSHADTYIVEGLALSLLQRLEPEDSPEGQMVARQRRVLQYRLEVFSSLPMAGSNPDEWPADYLDVLAAQPREQDSALVYLERAKVPVDPPPQWVTSQPPRFP